MKEISQLCKDLKNYIEIKDPGFTKCAITTSEFYHLLDFIDKKLAFPLDDPVNSILRGVEQSKKLVHLFALNKERIEDTLSHSMAPHVRNRPTFDFFNKYVDKH